MGSAKDELNELINAKEHKGFCRPELEFQATNKDLKRIKGAGAVGLSAFSALPVLRLADGFSRRRENVLFAFARFVSLR